MTKATSDEKRVLYNDFLYGVLFYQKISKCCLILFSHMFLKINFCTTNCCNLHTKRTDLFKFLKFYHQFKKSQKTPKSKNLLTEYPAQWHKLGAIFLALLQQLRCNNAHWWEYTFTEGSFLFFIKPVLIHLQGFICIHLINTCQSTFVCNA